MLDADIFDKLGGGCAFTRRSEAIRLHPLITFGAKHLYFKYPSITTKYGRGIPPHTTENVVISCDRYFRFCCESEHFIHPNIDIEGLMCTGRSWFDQFKQAYYDVSIEILYFSIEDWLSTSNLADRYFRGFNLDFIDKFWESGLRCNRCKCYDSETMKTNEYNITMCGRCISNTKCNFDNLRSISGLKKCEHCYQFDYAFKFRNKRHVRC